ncbi:hypothetical protein D9757_005215 [Collybiopsis confluens]|uniref:MACPF domain-containing protein n=1 Tax=Collybiopsis confluens TaxID=2823264 RepID=A0A8H5HVM0_9AGAR|nr:hypothetical protein D9757_005215 [Collybiopsis confluens]
MGPPGLTFPSFKSTDLSTTGFKDFQLANIRHKGEISTKLTFTADGKTSISDDTTLEYYMSLSADGQAILQPKGGTSVSARQAATTADSSADSGPETPSVKSAPGVQTFNVRLIDRTPTTTPEADAPMPDTSAAKELVEKFRTAGFLTRGELPTFTDRAMAALTANYAATGPNDQKYYSALAQAAELTEGQWDVVLKNTRAFHGYYYDFNRGILRKALKPAFRLKPGSIPGKPLQAGGTENAGKAASAGQDKYTPSIPTFYVFDSASVKVMEIRHQIQDTLVKEGFDSLVVSGSLEGGAGSLSASFEKDEASTQQQTTASRVQNLAVTYNFPRVVVELEPECLELTPECFADTSKLKNDEDRKLFYRRYGNQFATSITLGGYLYSTRSVTEAETSKLDQIKNETRSAAGISFTSPKISGSFGVANGKGEQNENGHAELRQTASLTWDAHGGDTLLVSNPNVWATTVKDHRLWRLMDQREVVELDSLFETVNKAAYDKLRRPSPESYGDKDPFKDAEYTKKLRASLRGVFREGKNNDVKTKMENLYNTKYSSDPGNAEYNTFWKTNYAGKPEALITVGTAFKDLNGNQQIDLGLYMVYKKELQGLIL